MWEMKRRAGTCAKGGDLKPARPPQTGSLAAAKGSPNRAWKSPGKGAGKGAHRGRKRSEKSVVIIAVISTDPLLPPSSGLVPLRSSAFESL